MKCLIAWDKKLGVVTGALGESIGRWDSQIAHMPAAERRDYRYMLTHGVDWPWLDGVPPVRPCRYGGRRMRNHPELHLRPDAVWKTLKKIFSTRSARWWDTKHGRRLPMGMHPIRWVPKGDTTDVRITWNMVDFNKLLDPAAATVELETARKLRHRVQRHDLMGGLDLSSSFYHCKYTDRAAAWTGAAVCSTELPEGVWDKLYESHPCAHFRRDGKDWLVFVLLGVTMGAAPSVKQFTDLMAVPVQAWMRCPVGTEADGTLESWRSTIYIDDLQYFVAGGFSNAVELTLRLVAEMALLGFTVNFKPGKSQLLPDVRSRHIGYVWASVLMRISLPDSRVAKTFKAVRELRLQVRDTGWRPHARAVARVIGLLWSAHMVAHRAVSLLCRGMIATLAVALGSSDIHDAAVAEDYARLRWLLKAVYDGAVVWTGVAEGELTFWGDTDFAALEGDVAFHCLDSEFQEWCWRPADSVAADDVRVFAVDTSDSASGGGEFLADGGVWRLSDDGMMVTMLSPAQVVTSSTARECKGCVDVDETCVPDSCTKAVVLCDNQSTVSVMSKGSGIPALNACAVTCFRRALRAHRILHYVWIGRAEGVIVACDAASRLRLTSDVATPAEIFWRANAVACQLFGRGFQFDRFASAKTACPPDTLTKLPFNSQYRAPGSAGRDAMAQYWVGYINWVCPPFVLLDAVLDLMWAQGVAGAVVVPWSSGQGRPWRPRVSTGAVGVCGRFTYKPRDFGDGAYRGVYAVAFLDYRRAGGAVSTGPSAESFGRTDLLRTTTPSGPGPARPNF
jgi:hypothetical protein